MSGRTLRILQLYPKADYYTGAAIQLYELASALVRRGHTVVVATRPSERWARKSRAAGLVHCPIPMRSEFDLASVRDLVRIVRAHEIEIVHAHKGKARTLTLLAGLVAPIPVLVLNRGVSFPLDRYNRLGYVTAAVTAIITVSQSIKDGLVRQGVPSEKIIVIYSGTDTTRFHPAIEGEEVRRELGLEPDHFVITQVGIRSWKGNNDVVAAMALVAPRFPQARLLFVGANVTKARILEEQAKARGIGDAVIILGFRDDIPQILAASDVVVDASYAGLGLTGSLREALAVGTPVIATDIEGNPELIVHGETGLLVPPRAPDRLAHAIITLATNRPLAEALAVAGRRRVEAQFSMQAKVEETEALYRRLARRADLAHRPGHRRLDGRPAYRAVETMAASPECAAGDQSADSTGATRWRLAFFASSAGFLALALIVSLGGVLEWERALSRPIVLLATPEVRDVFSWVTALGSRKNLYPLGLLILVSLPTVLLRRWWLWGLVIVAAAEVEELTKDLVGRPRPIGPQSGFPSGHTAAATGFFVTAAYLAGQALNGAPLKLTAWFLAVLTAAMVGVSRLVLNVHWLLDVVGGGLLGIACAAAAASWNERNVLGPSPFRSVTWIAFRMWAYRWQAVLPIPAFAVVFLTPPFVEEDSILDDLSDWTGVCMILVGMLIRIWAAGHGGGRYWFRPLTAIPFVTRGPYAYVRNPLPLANVVIGVGVMLAAENALGLVVVPAVLIAISRLTLPLEEQALSERFGAGYADYCRHVPRWVPRWRPALPPQPNAFVWRSLHSESPVAVGAMLLGWMAEASEHLPHLLG